MHRLTVTDFRLDTTLASGQTFRWQQVDGWYYGVIHGVLVRITQHGDELCWDCSDHTKFTADDLAHYFSLDHDLDAIFSTLPRDPHLTLAFNTFRGLRLIRQEPWECMASYVLTSFNNIQRITCMIENIAQHFGAPIEHGRWRAHTFPDAATLAKVSVGQLGLMGLGFRAAYLLQVSQRAAAGQIPFAQLMQAPYAVVKSTLRQLPGIGDKVADCVALFGFQHYAAFPIDVWTKRSLGLYMAPAALTVAKMHAFAADHFGAYAGYAQQYLYHWMRTRSSFAQRTVAQDAHRLPSRLLLESTTAS
jgi:N-glycosylase/DNA lyase